MGLRLNPQMAQESSWLRLGTVCASGSKQKKIYYCLILVSIYTKTFYQQMQLFITILRLIRDPKAQTSLSPDTSPSSSETFPGQLRDVVPPACPRSSPGSAPSGRFLFRGLGHRGPCLRLPPNPLCAKWIDLQLSQFFMS